MSGASSRRKGHNYERELARELNAAFPHLDIKRGLGQTRDGSDVPDVEFPGYWIEAKRQKKCNVKGALEQAREAASRSGRPGPLVPVAICKDDRQPAIVAMFKDDWLDLIRNQPERIKQNANVDTLHI